MSNNRWMKGIILLWPFQRVVTQLQTVTRNSQEIGLLRQSVTSQTLQVGPDNALMSNQRRISQAVHTLHIDQQDRLYFAFEHIPLQQYKFSHGNQNTTFTSPTTQNSFSCTPNGYPISNHLIPKHRISISRHQMPDLQLPN